MAVAAFAIGSDIWPGIAKLAEEAAEVVQVCMKLVATGGDVNHWGRVGPQRPIG